MKAKIAESRFLRRLFFPLLRKLNFELKITHDVSKRKFSLLFWDHKGYWYYGKKREEEELSMLKRLIKKGDVVLEVGGHIGYLSQVFEFLVGDCGKVFVAEPTPKSRSFLEKNVKRETVVFPFAISESNTEMDFYLEEFGGFTNSLIEEFTENSTLQLSDSQLIKNQDSLNKILVQVRTIDSICEEHGITPNFLKIDIEGAEFDALKGATKILKEVDCLMVEVSRNHKGVFDLLKEYDFIALDTAGMPLEEENEDENKNVFFVKHYQ